MKEKVCGKRKSTFLKEKNAADVTISHINM